VRGWTILEKALALLILVGVGLHFAVPVDRLHRNVQFMPDMAYSPSFGTHESNPVFEDGKTMQHPPEGTIPRGALPMSVDGRRLEFDGKWEDLSVGARADWEGLVPPYAAFEAKELAEVKARGAAVFNRLCATCHGASGLGDGTVTKRGVPPPPSLLAENALGLSDGHIFRIVSAGQGNMAPFARHITKEDRWKALLYVRSLQGK